MFVIISSVPHTDFGYLTSRQSYRSRNPVSWIPPWFLPGSRVTVCFVLGVSPGQKPTRRAYKFRFILSLSKNASPWNEDVLRGYAKADFIVIFFSLLHPSPLLRNWDTCCVSFEGQVQLSLASTAAARSLWIRKLFHPLLQSLVFCYFCKYIIISTLLAWKWRWLSGTPRWSFPVNLDGTCGI